MSWPILFLEVQWCVPLSAWEEATDSVSPSQPFLFLLGLLSIPRGGPQGDWDVWGDRALSPQVHQVQLSDHPFRGSLRQGFAVVLVDTYFVELTQLCRASKLSARWFQPALPLVQWGCWKTPPPPPSARKTCQNLQTWTLSHLKGRWEVGRRKGTARQVLGFAHWGQAEGGCPRGRGILTVHPALPWGGGESPGGGASLPLPCTEPAVYCCPRDILVHWFATCETNPKSCFQPSCCGNFFQCQFCIIFERMLHFFRLVLSWQREYDSTTHHFFFFFPPGNWHCLCRCPQPRLNSCSFPGWACQALGRSPPYQPLPQQLPVQPVFVIPLNSCRKVFLPSGLLVVCAPASLLTSWDIL